MIQLKTKDDIRRIRDSGFILSQTFTHLEKHLAENITTSELDRIASEFIYKKGAVPTFLGYFNYPASICISINNEVIHGIPGERKLRPGDIVSIDLGVTFKGYISDAARTYGIGRITDQDKELIDVTRECLQRGIANAVSANRLGDISQAIYTHALDHGFQVVREFCGHGVGFALHEDPQIFNYPAAGPNKKLKAGMVLAIEPMLNRGTWQVRILDDGWTVITADGKNSAHFEHTVAILDDHTEILTEFP
jgi:methionyl aminopeptidase